MAKLIKSANGLLFNDDFSTRTLMWELSPSEKSSVLEFSDKGLRIKHSDTYVTYTIVEPEAYEYCLVTRIDHHIFNENDVCGVIIMSSTEQYAECQSCYTDMPSAITNTYHTHDVVFDSDAPEEELSPVDWDITEYSWIKVHKILGSYLFYASIDGYNWITVGSAKYEHNGCIGLFQYAARDKNNHVDNALIDNSYCYFRNFDIYKGKSIIINGIDRQTYDLEITDEHGHILVRTDNPHLNHLANWKESTCIIDTTSFPIPSKAIMKVYERRHYDESNRVYDLGTIYGGDVFEYEHDIRLFVENVEVSQDELYDLGDFYSGSYYIRLEVHNFDDETVYNKTVKVIRYSEYYSGEEEIDIADADPLMPGEMPYSLDYKKEVVLDEIRQSAGRNLYIRLTDKPVNDFFTTANDFRFKITIE